MNQLDNVNITNSTITYPTISGGNMSAINAIGTSSLSTLSLDPSCTIYINDYSIKASDLAVKLQLLDKLIAQFYPETLI